MWSVQGSRILAVKDALLAFLSSYTAGSLFLIYFCPEIQQRVAFTNKGLARNMGASKIRICWLQFSNKKRSIDRVITPLK